MYIRSSLIGLCLLATGVSAQITGWTDSSTPPAGGGDWDVLYNVSTKGTVTNSSAGLLYETSSSAIDVTDIGYIAGGFLKPKLNVTKFVAESCGKCSSSTGYNGCLTVTDSKGKWLSGSSYNTIDIDDFHWKGSLQRFVDDSPSTFSCEFNFTGILDGRQTKYTASASGTITATYPLQIIISQHEFHVNADTKGNWTTTPLSITVPYRGSNLSLTNGGTEWIEIVGPENTIRVEGKDRTDIRRHPNTTDGFLRSDITVTFRGVTKKSVSIPLTLTLQSI